MTIPTSPKPTPLPIEREELFICGPYDGKWLTVNSDVKTVQLPTKHHLQEDRDGELEMVFSGKITYHRHFLKGERKAFFVFTPERVNTDEMLSWLVAGYGSRQRVVAVT